MKKRSAETEVIVVGGGIVGLACAVQLTIEGHRVSVIEPNEPASGCSSGNAGYLADAAIFPPAAYVKLRRVPGMLVDPLGPLAIRPSHVLRFMPWAVRALASLQGRNLEETVAALAALNKSAIGYLGAMLDACDAADLIDLRGALVVCRTEALLEERARMLPVLEAHGIAARRLTGDEVRELEPALSADVVGGIFFPDSGRCLDPRGVGRCFAAKVVEWGGRLIRARATAISPKADGTWSVHTDSGVHAVRAVVVCAGRWSDALVRPLGYRVPLESERGYHLMLPNPDVTLMRPVVLAERHFVATTMSAGLRLAGTSEFADIDAPMNPQRADMMYGLAAGYLTGLKDEGAVRWLGVRSALPDARPAIGESRRHRNLFYCFGHHHLGLTCSAISAKIVAELVGGKAPPVDPRPFRIERFVGCDPT